MDWIVKLQTLIVCQLSMKFNIEGLLINAESKNLIQKQFFVSARNRPQVKRFTPPRKLNSDSESGSEYSDSEYSSDYSDSEYDSEYDFITFVTIQVRVQSPSPKSKSKSKSRVQF